MQPYLELNSIAIEDPVTLLPGGCAANYDLLVLGQDYITDFDSNGDSVFNGTNLANGGGTYIGWTVPNTVELNAVDICAN